MAGKNMRELMDFRDWLAILLQTAGGRITDVGMDLTDASADIRVIAPDGTALEITMRKGKR